VLFRSVKHFYRLYLHLSMKTVCPFAFWQNFSYLRSARRVGRDVLAEGARDVDCIESSD
jgi:hypothetical protein